MKKQVLVSALLLIGCLSIISTASAAGQYGPYGGSEQPSNIMVDKLVSVPSSDNKGGVSYTYVDNLSKTDYKYKAGNYIWFKIKVQNTSNKTLNNAMVEDTFPQYLEVFPESYKYDAQSRKLIINLGSLKAGETKEITLKARVLPAQQLPADKGLFCIVNTVKAYSGNISDTDNSQLCIEKQVIGTTTPPTEIPSTGAEFPLMLSLTGALGYVGARLRRFGNNR